MTTRTLAGIAVAVVVTVLLCCGAATTLILGSAAATAGCHPTTNAAPTHGAASDEVDTWNPDQVANATTIITTGIRLGIPPRGWVIAVATAMQESSLTNLPGGDQDSVGLFQQRPSQGWGTPQQLHDPTYAATRFYNKLLTIPGWQTMPLTQAAQHVQHSAYPDAYAQWETDADHLVETLVGHSGSWTPAIDREDCPSRCSTILSNGGGVTSATRVATLPGSTNRDEGCRAGLVALERAETWLTAWNGGPVPYLSSADPTTWFQGYRRDCSGYASMALGLPGPGLSSAGLAARATPIAKTDLQAGDLLINPAPDLAGHVVIFDHWTDASMTRYVGYEQAGDGGTHHRTIPYPYFGGYQMKPYRL